ncbi:MAG: ThuA domain-containing protein [Clostridia bacterium]|nr:ThuA domain-containing protein [Clostridia bacterium]
MNNNIQLHYLIGDVHMGGHDVQRIAHFLLELLAETGKFTLTAVCDEPTFSAPGAEVLPFDEYFAENRITEADIIVFNCGNYRFNVPAEQKMLCDAVAGGCGFVFLHGDHPCYWTDCGMKPFPEIEKMAGLMWRNATCHGDYADTHVRIDAPDHPIMQGLTAFDTRDELFCTCENVFGVPLRVLASAYSDPDVKSRHGLPGTGKWEPVAVLGQYGAGKTFNLLLGHVWPYYTGHGIGENTMLSWKPAEVREMFVRACAFCARE